MIKIIAIASLVVCSLFGSALGQASEIQKVDIGQAEVDRIVRAVTANEGKFREALKEYVFSRSASISTVGMGGQLTGTYRRDSFMGFNPDGSRTERIDFAPIPTLTEVTITPADLDNLNGLDPFAIEPKNADKYAFTFVGKEKIDELDLYVFDVAPKVMPEAKKNGLQLFKGRIWVDDHDLLIVKSRGKAVPEWKNERFPIIETWRENVDGKHWFPSFSSSDDELVFENGNVVKMKVRVKYKDYAVGHTSVKAVGEDEDVPATPKPKKPE
jgi:hypothetical protein